MDLSDRQRVAVEAPTGGLFLSAAAGSGKTRVLTARFVRLIEEGVRGLDEDPLSRLAAITFTEKAAGELSERIRGALACEVSVDVARAAEGAWISTIHGLCSRILRRHAFEAGLDPLFSVVDEVQAGVLRQEAFERALRDLTKSPGVARLVADYELADIEDGIRTVAAKLTSLGVASDAISLAPVDLESVLADSKKQLDGILSRMKAIPGRAAREEGNIEAIKELLSRLDSASLASFGEEERAAAVMAVTADAMVHTGCRECSKELAKDAKSEVERLVQTAADHAATGYAEGFVELLDRTMRAYEELKSGLRVLDFDDLQLRTLALFTNRPEIASAYRAGFREVMVDEFQDTNELQLTVVSSLAGDRLTTVGDEQQSIYGWRNADVELFRRRRQNLPADRVFSLPENYRSHPDLVALFNRLFSTEPFWPGDFMQLEPTQGDGEQAWPAGLARAGLTVLDAEQCRARGRTRPEAEVVAEYMSTLRDTGVPQKDMVVLLRAMTHAEEYESALRDRGFDVYVCSGGSYFDSIEVAELEALLRTIANTSDDEAFAHVLASRMTNVSDDALHMLRMHTSVASHASLYDAARDPEGPRMSDPDERAIDFIVDAISELRRMRGHASLSELVHQACERIDYDLVLAAVPERRAWANALKFARLAKEYERLAPGDASAFLDHLSERQRHKRYEPQAAVVAEGVDAVRIMSVHSAKGLEFPVVVLAELGADPRKDSPVFDCGSPDGRLVLGARLPAGESYAACRQSSAAAAVRAWRLERESAEAKRLLYVACTRATESLALFGVMDLAKPLPNDRPVGWICAALGVEPSDGVGALAQEPVLVTIRGSGAVGDAPGSPGSEASRTEDRAEARCTQQQATARSVPPAAGPPRSAPSPAGSPPAALADAFTPKRISYSGLKTYRTCPYRYYVTYVARLHTLDTADAPDARTIGSVLHQALRLAGTSGVLAADRVGALLAREGLAPGEAARVEAVLRAFAESALAGRVSEANAVLSEAPFGVRVGETVLHGAIDLLAIEDAAALVVDFKTGAGRIDDATIQDWRLQSRCYALAVLEARPSLDRVDVVFYRPEVDVAVQSAEISFVYARAEIDTIRADLETTIAGISAGDFSPRATYDPRSCDECPARSTLCPVPNRARGIARY